MIKRVLFGLFFCAAVISCKSSTQLMGIHLGKIDVEVRKLSNGLKVILVEDHHVPLVSYQTWFRVGSVDEKPGNTGISHLFEHLMFKGTPQYGPRQFFEQLEAKGAEVNAFTTRDYTVYYENFVPALLDKVIEMEADRMANLSIQEDVLNTEKKVVLEERRLKIENSPGGKIDEALWKMAYGNHPYAWPVIGYPEDLTATTLSQVIDYFKTHYQPANASLVVVGDFDGDALFDKIKNYYGKIPERPRPKREIEPLGEQKEERRLILRDLVASERFAHAYPISSADNEDSYALDVLTNILFYGTSSRAHRLLIEEKNIAIGISGYSFTPRYPGLMILNVTMKNGIPAAEGERLIHQLIEEVKMSGVTEDEIKMAVKQLTVQLVDGIRTPYGLGILLGAVDAVLGDPLRYEEDVSKYFKVTDADIRRVARNYLIPNHRSVVTLIPEVRK